MYFLRPVYFIRGKLSLGLIDLSTRLPTDLSRRLQVPSNALLKKFKPHLFLGICIGLFGVVSLCQGFVTNYAGLLATRFLLGLFEAGIFPGCFYLLAMWYKREESQKRFTFFFLSTVLAGAFGGLLASAIGKMDGMAGKSAWRWIFIIGSSSVNCPSNEAFN